MRIFYITKIDGLLHNMCDKPKIYDIIILVLYLIKVVRYFYDLPMTMRVDKLILQLYLFVVSAGSHNVAIALEFN